ncbi:signal recognition particle-docking protein FtsY [Spirulina major]|uniref:signal recognition particle-docking protein FtsY n=1 Tax=Spirulina major TaxID=270636 RepID=UPI000A9FFEFE|nr:signal recognition particle-docking protein FtsY [Spirulina major]
MPVFNWFKRKKKQDDPVSDSPQPEVKETPSEEPAPTSEETDPALDYLQWAKAAYQNIQGQQSEPAPTATVEPEPEPDEPTPPADPEPARSEPDSSASDPVAEDSEPTPAAAVETLAPEPEPAEPIAPEPTPEPEPAPSSPQPAWMKKSDGLERLKETAIADDEPEPAMAFDDDFMWSAKILAEQGRRPEDIDLEEISWLKRLRDGLGKTRRSLVNQLKAVVGQGPLNDEAVLEIEALLLQADVGVVATDHIIETLQNRLREDALPPDEAIAYLKEILCSILDQPLPDPHNAALVPVDNCLNIWLMTGVNGAGKTTTIGKLANLAQKSGYPCLIAAADTFRAAAVEQVKVWGDRTQTAVIANPGKNTDPAAVVYDAIAAAQARNTQLLLVDTAGRLQNKQNLMEELSKIRRIIDKKAPNAVIESLLVLDATLGQNGLRQAQVFSESAQLSGVVLTKLDGTAKGGVALAVAQQLNLPIRFIGAGEGIEDLRPFSSYEFVEALLSE